MTDVQSTTTTRADAPGHERFRTPEPTDGREIWALVRRVGLDLNSPYAYVLWGDHFADTSVVAVRDDQVVGFAMGFRTPADPDTLFIWQIGVDEGARGSGLASRMLDELVERTGVAVTRRPGKPRPVQGQAGPSTRLGEVQVGRRDRWPLKTGSGLQAR